METKKTNKMKTRRTIKIEGKKTKKLSFRTTKKIYDLIEANSSDKSYLINYALFYLFYCKPTFAIREISEGEEYDYYDYEDYLDNNLEGVIDLEHCINTLGMISECYKNKQVLNSDFKDV